MAKKLRKNGKPQPRAKAAETPKAQPPVNAMDVLKERMQQANKSSLMDALNQVKNTKPEEWKDADRVKELAKKLAGSLNLKVSEERLDQFMKAYKDATKGGQPQDPKQILQKYGQGKIDPQSMNDINKFLK
ncbi:hypothetical protein [Effusibacillus pohliae]|uniref:hypothetical protein n=1 Tax=Effusibacillus pohliae TaxID=232270 RepID=UPI00037E45E9|nr:hypothetical protein [Effusibacillus pohliae]